MAAGGITGVTVSNSAYADYQQFAMKKPRGTVSADGKEFPAKIVYAFWSIKDKKEIVTESVQTGLLYSLSDSKAEVNAFPPVFAAFAKALIAHAGPCYAAIALHYLSGDGRFIDRDVLIRWSPDATAPLQAKLLYSGTEGAIKGKFGKDKVLQCTDVSDVTLENFIQFAGKD